MTTMGCKRDPNAPRKGLNRTRTRLNRTELKSRTKTIRPVSRTERRKLELKADSLWSQFIRLRAGGKCEYCGKPGDDPHHVSGRWDKHSRHHPGNGAFICRLDHDSAHQNPDNFRIWFRMTFPDRVPPPLNCGPVTKEMLRHTIEQLTALIDSFLPTKAGN